MLNNNSLEQKIKTPVDELDYFKEKVEKKAEIKYGENFNTLNEEKKIDLIKNSLEEHQKQAPEIVESDLLVKSDDAEKIILKLNPDKDDEKMEELLGIMYEVGIFNTIKAIEKTESFHILDDFHRFLVQYIDAGYDVGVKEKNEIYPGLHMSLYEIILPSLDDESEDTKGKKLEELLSSMEQFYAGMFALAENGVKNYFSIEISFPQGRDQVSFFCAVPHEKSGIFKNHLLAVFSEVKIKEVTDDYNIFNGLKYVSGSEVEFTDSNFLPIKTYKELEYDPLNIILQSFNNFSINEGASIQIMLSPAKQSVNNDFGKKVDDLKEGKDIKSVIRGKSNFIEKSMDFIHEAIFSGSGDEKKEEKIEDQERRSILVEELKKKNSSRLYNTNIRFITSGSNQSHSNMLLNELESSFLQFENINGNKFKFKKIVEKKIDDFVRKYTFRIFDKEKALWLNTAELTSIFHFPKQKLSAGGILTSSKTTSAQVSSKIAQIGKSEDFTGSIKSSENNQTSFIPEIEEKKDIWEMPDIFSKENNIDVPPEEPSEDIIKANIPLKNDLLNFKLNKEEFFENERDFLSGKTDFYKEKVNEPFFVVDEQNKKEVGKEQEIVQKFVKRENDFRLKTKEEIRKTESNHGGLKNMGDDSFKKGKNIILGINEHQGAETPIYFQPLDRMRHMYLIGQTGTGKSTLLKNMIVQDIKNGEGICFIDPHGSDIEDILASIPPERHDDVIYFDPSDLDRPLGLNMLEYDASHPEQKSFVVNELLAIFEKLFDMKKNGSGGPMFEMYFRNSALLAIDDPHDQATLYDIVRILSDKDFREEKLKKSTNLTVNQFWRKIADQAGGEASMENVVPYITSKFDNFLSNDYMRPIVSQPKSSFNFREVMDEKKILLINLSKGRLGELNANLLGLIIVGKILMAALSRVDSLDKNLAPFYLYIDEFQNVTTDSISQILSEARKYKLSLNIAHQYIKQIDEGIKDSVFGNVGSMAIFRVGQEDAEFLEKQLKPTFDASDITSIDNRNAYLKLLVDGEPQKPFNIRTLAPEEGSKENAQRVIQLSRQKYGADKKEVEELIRRKISFL